ncbi:hypothetical protein GEMRC1_007935 [Eukaryota sp. GEM-RC1]
MAIIIAATSTSYLLPTKAPFTARIVNAAHNVTEDDIKHSFSSLSVKEVRSLCHKPGVFFVEFQDAEGLKQCLDHYWLFEIKGRPIRTFIVPPPRPSVKNIDNCCRGETEASVVEPEHQEKHQHRVPSQWISFKEDRPEREFRSCGFDLNEWRGSTVPSSVEIDVKPEQERRPLRARRHRSPHKEETLPKEDRPQRESKPPGFDPNVLSAWRGSTVPSSVEIDVKPEHEKRTVNVSSRRGPQEEGRAPHEPRFGKTPPVAAGRPHDESYVLPTQAPFIAKIINAAYSVTEDDLIRALSSLFVKDIKPFGHKGGNFLVEFQDVQGLKQCLDKYWGFGNQGSPNQNPRSRA